MGGDGGVDVTIPAVAQALETNPDLSVFLLGDEHRMRPLLAAVNGRLRSRIELLHTSDVILDDDKPGNALRNARQSSMYMAVELLKNGKVEAMVSAGNTGALLMIGRSLLKTIKGIKKPAIVATIPGAYRQSYLLDVGANPDCDSQQLFEFAVMGSVLAESLHGESVKVGLLNIGAEQFKGTDAVREAAARMQRCPDLNYIGFVEANALFEGVADVVVCDGFVGNVIIKASAGVANVVKSLITEAIQADADGSSALIDRLHSQIDPHRFNGASLLGLQGSIVKSHGNATVEGFSYAIQQAVTEIENAVPQLIAEKVAAIIERTQ